MKKKGSANTDALGAALRLLGVRQRSVFELTAKLKDKGFDSVEIDKTVERLKEAGYLNDGAFARALASSRASHKAWGPARIARDLTARGIDRETIKDAVEQACPSEEELAKAAFERWRKRNSLISGRELQIKAFRHLSARGFSPSAVWKAIGKAGGDEGSQD